MNTVDVRVFPSLLCYDCYNRVLKFLRNVSSDSVHLLKTRRLIQTSMKCIDINYILLQLLCEMPNAIHL